MLTFWCYLILKKMATLCRFTGCLYECVSFEHQSISKGEKSIFLNSLFFHNVAHCLGVPQKTQISNFMLLVYHQRIKKHTRLASYDRNLIKVERIDQSDFLLFSRSK